MKSKILKKYILEQIIHFECEDMNYFENPYSSDVEDLECSVDDENSWCTMDTSTSDKPLTAVLDLEAKERGFYTGRVRGVYLLDVNINDLKLYEGTQNIRQKAEYFAYDEPMHKIIKMVDSPIDEVSFGYAEGFKEKILDLICSR